MAFSESLGMAVCPHTPWMTAPWSPNLICWIVAEPWFLAPVHKILKLELQCKKRSDKEGRIMQSAGTWLNPYWDTVVQWPMSDCLHVCVFTPRPPMLFSVPVKAFICLEPTTRAQNITCAPSTMNRRNNKWIPFTFQWNRNQDQSSMTALQCRIKTCGINTRQRTVREMWSSQTPGWAENVNAT